MRASWADLILGVIGTVKSRDYKLWWTTVKHPSSSPLTFTGKCAVNDRDEIDHGLGSCHKHSSYKHTSLPSTCASYLHYPWALWQGNSMKFNEFWTWHNYFQKSDCARDISVTDSPTCRKPGESLHWCLYDFTKIASKHPALHLEDGSKHSGLLWGGFFHPWA